MVICVDLNDTTGCRPAKECAVVVQQHKAPCLLWGINTDVDIILITSSLYTTVVPPFSVFHCFLLRVQESVFTFSHFLHLLSLTTLVCSFSSHSFQKPKLFLVSCFAFEIAQLFESLVSVAWGRPCHACTPSPGCIWRTSACRPAAECLQD